MSQLDQSSSASDDRPIFGVAGGIGSGLVKRMLSGLRHGRLRVVLPSGAAVEKTGAGPGPDATIVMRNWRMLRRIVLGGDVGFAEAYMDGDWSTPDLTALIRLAAQNTAVLSPAIEASPLVRLLNRFQHMRNANTRRGSRRNIEAHYDLGNEFYRRWLDPSMLYSSALWEADHWSLEEAQQAKLARIRRNLQLTGGEQILEIGCGWGALAIDLAQSVNASVTGITLSPSQLAWARDAATRAGAGDRIDLRLEDYRDVQGSFDRIVSVEMFEAVGEAYWPSYFETLRRCMKPAGRAVLQIITIDEERFDGYRRSPDFIQKYIFPGGFLPSKTALAQQVEAAGLSLAHSEHFGKSYARTLAEWRSRFHANWPAIAALGFDERFRRMWDYYLCYCEAGFEEGTIDVGLYTITHAD